jgi:hypothetical protein
MHKQYGKRHAWWQVPADINRKRRRRTKAATRWVRSDGGRRAAGHCHLNDCVIRAIAVATEKPYHEVHGALAAATIRYVKTSRSRVAGWIKRSRGGRGLDPSHGSYDAIYRPYLASLGWRFVSTKNNRKVRLRADELPPGRLIVRVHRHLVAVIDGVIHDTFNSGQAGRRPVIGYYTAEVQP